MIRVIWLLVFQLRLFYLVSFNQLEKPELVVALSLVLCSDGDLLRQALVGLCAALQIYMGARGRRAIFSQTVRLHSLRLVLDSPQY